MSNVIRKEMYVKSDVTNNNNKFWEVQILSDNSAVMRWGRVGDPGQSQVKNFGSLSEVERFVDGKIKEKTRDGRNGEIAYRKIDVVGDVTSTRQASQPVSNVNLSQIAAKQIKTNNPIVEDLIKYLVKVNIHKICSATTMTYNDTTGLFSTPLGIVTQNNIDSANDILVKIGDIVAIQNYSDKNLISYTNDFLMLVPQNIGRVRLDVEQFWNDLSKVQAQKQLLDSLQVSLDMASKNKSSTNSKDPEQKVFDVQMELIEDKKFIKETFDHYMKMRSTMHSACYHLKPKQIWSVKIATMEDAFKKDGAKMDNIIEGYHGSNSTNGLAILSSGMRIMPNTSPNVCGRLYGNGLYCAPTQVLGSSTKACNYAVGGVWSGSRSSRVFCFIIDMAMGKYYTPTANNYQRISYPVSGFDSCWAKGNISGVKNDECIVYRTSQVNIKYLFELE